MNYSFKIPKRTVFFLLSTALVAGCAVGPDYKKPKIELVPFHNAGEAANNATNQPVKLDTWWTEFNDPELTKIEEQALAQNLDLAAAMARVSQARAAASGSSAQLLPTFDLDGSITKEHQSLLGPFGSIAKTVPTYKRNTTDWPDPRADGHCRGELCSRAAQASETVRAFHPRARRQPVPIHGSHPPARRRKP